MAVIFALPLLYVPSYSLLSHSLRLGLLISLGVYILVFKGKEVIKNFSKLNTINKWCISGLLFALYLSTILTSSDYYHLFFGWPESRHGLIAWFIYILMGVYLIGIKLTDNLLKIIYIIIISVLFISLFMHFGYLGEYRLFGLLLQSTSMGLYACLGIAISTLMIIKNCKPIDIMVNAIILSLSTVIVILSASRISVITGILIIIGLSIAQQAKVNIYKVILMLLAIVFAILAVTALSSIDDRLSTVKTFEGTRYRISIYNAYIQNYNYKEILIGNGASTFPNEINDETNLSADLAETVREGYIFMSSQNIVLDTLFMFGITYTLSLLVIIYMSIKNIVKYYTAGIAYLFFVAAYVIAIINGLINTQSLGLTSLLIIFVIIFANYQYNDKVVK